MDELLETVTTAESSHEGFRVWITTEAHNQFPISLLQVPTDKYGLYHTVESPCYISCLPYLSKVKFCYTRIIFSRDIVQWWRNNQRTLLYRFCKGGLVLAFFSLGIRTGSHLCWSVLVNGRNLNLKWPDLPNLEPCSFSFAHHVSSFIVLDKIHKWAATGREARIKENVRWNHSGPVGCD